MTLPIARTSCEMLSRLPPTAVAGIEGEAAAMLADSEADAECDAVESADEVELDDDDNTEEEEELLVVLLKRKRVNRGDERSRKECRLAWWSSSWWLS